MLSVTLVLMEIYYSADLRKVLSSFGISGKEELQR